MAAKTTGSGQYANNLLLLVFNATAFATVAQNEGTSPLTDLYVSLHTATPGATGSQNTNEAAYTSYARVAVVRTSSGWTVTDNSVSPVANIDFPTATGGSETETYAGIGSSSSGAGNLFYFGPITPNIAVVSGVTPELTTSSTITET
jgi:hypothetical protein